ncbi:DEAD/DEAH box helicase [Vibrio parahaemolyticus]|uniref:DEAD/DEAH box helicase n=2 Tax=Vibrio parahaemolyticus TaxID=670 RepID=UPI0011224002|nr:DEAD/DEAH box helicase [Vibrio parahaemolyticus]ELA8131910.1 DEAD/DEAH box helicase [Vibrio parahaemolyticus]TOK78204.1 helicase [Vibrio parahaemolyticus]HCG7440270.1 DEAD/DEAH box helicase [Vibrio parahaemolyticus]
MLKINEIQHHTNPSEEISRLISHLHKNGPIENKVIENLTYFKHLHPEDFAKYEEQIISTLGLFYKNPYPNNLLSFILSGIGHQHKKNYGEYLTPVQASVRVAIEEQQFVSISAPTSAGKSFSIRDYIFEMEGDAVIVVPSRALIAEYIKSMRDKFKNDKNVMISSFVDYVFTERNLRRIFILTPERARELFSSKFKPNISLFFFDEAQVSEEKERGVIFDVLIRRVQRSYPDAKLIFAHPFVDNPEAQITKHDIDKEKSYSRSYPHSTVGKVFVYGHKNHSDYYFSPFTPNGHHVKDCIKLDHKFEDFAFRGDKSVLVFVSKASIYRGDFIDDFEQYVDNFQPVENEKATKIIEEVESALGANDTNHRSKLVALLKRGVVIHHGSVPLEVRFLVEDFIREGFAKICFATSTLAQGVNMPFDIVWLDNMRIMGDTDEDRALAFKNLIGRSGRLSELPKFDFGYVYTKNAKLLSERLNVPFNLSEESMLDLPEEELEDERELVSSMIDGSFNEDINLPDSKIDRLSAEHVTEKLERILNIIYTNELGSKLFGTENRPNRDLVKSDLMHVYQASLGRDLNDGEKNVFNTAIEIFFHVIQGRPFREIVGIRYSYITNRGGNQNEQARFTQPANKLPESTLKVFPLFKNVQCKNASYDAVVFDTYDYLDTVISFSLSDVFIGAFKIYHNLTKNDKALKMIELLRYGTNNTLHTLLLRYGFPPEEVSELSHYIDKISEENILFKPDIYQSPSHIQDMVDWYLP